MVLQNLLGALLNKFVIFGDHSQMSSTQIYRCLRHTETNMNSLLLNLLLGQLNQSSKLNLSFLQVLGRVYCFVEVGIPVFEHLLQFLYLGGGYRTEVAVQSQIQEQVTTCSLKQTVIVCCLTGITA